MKRKFEYVGQVIVPWERSPANFKTTAQQKQSDHAAALRYLNRLKDVNSPIDDMMNRILHSAIQRSDYGFFCSVLERKPDVNLQNKSGQTALHKAVKSGQLRQTRILLDNGADVELEDNVGRRAAHYVVASKDMKLKSLILNVANVKVKDHLGNTPLHAMLNCPEEQTEELCTILFDRGADPNERNGFGMTSFRLLWTCRRQFERDLLFDLMDLFVEHGALINPVIDDWSPLKMCIVDPEFDVDLMVRLIHYGANANICTGFFSMIDLCRDDKLKIFPLIKHLSIEASRGNFQFGQELSRSIHCDLERQIYFYACQKELADLVSDKFQSSKSFGLLDVLAEFRVRKLGRYCKNVEYRNKMVAFDSSNFPIYGDDLETKFEEGLRILETEDRGYSFFSLASRGVLNIDCIEAIMRYIPPKELLKLRNI